MAGKKSKRRKYLRSPQFAKNLEKAVGMIKDFVRAKTGARSPESFSPNQLFDTACAVAGIPRPRFLAGENQAEYAIRLIPFLGISKLKDNPAKALTAKKFLPKKPQLSGRELEIKQFYSSKEWRTSESRYTALRNAKGRCQCCGRSKDEEGIKLVVDHIKPVRKFWHLRFDVMNLQVLCNDCNLGKGSWDQTDWRNPLEIGDVAQEDIGVFRISLDEEMTLSHWLSI
jgi:hypothetical protein